MKEWGKRKGDRREGGESEQGGGGREREDREGGQEGEGVGE